MQLSEEHLLIQNTARRFAAHRLTPKAEDWDRKAYFPRDVISEMGDLGLLGILVPEDWGGANADFISYAVSLTEIAGGDGGLSTVMAVQAVAETCILAYGNVEQKNRFLPDLTSGRAIGAFLLSEPQTGSEASAITCKAHLDGNHYVLNGTKQFITSGANGNVAIAFAVTNPEEGSRGISAFIVPTDTPGYKVAKVEHKLGQKSSDTAQIVFDDLRLPTDLLLGEEGQGYKIALSNLEGGRIGIAAQAVGFAAAAYRFSKTYAMERETFGKRIIDHQAIGFKLAEMATQVEAGRHMMLNAANLKALGKSCLKEASMAKLFCSEMAERVCSDAIQVHGGYGYLSDFPVERIYRDARVCQIYEGTSEVQKLLICRAIQEET
ncbi:MAG: acyl-CoA dehydrogenase [Rhodospirillaceae bacterium TMED8]|nr:acyl-CoA dehydrogenase [Magnetovibrio sp.]OUT49608.1 MAG: acyl-CoA dehydrogenase [Rhodospirillaceae bacterium TMED8]